MSGREPSTCDTPVSYSIDIPTEELKVHEVTDKNNKEAHYEKISLLILCENYLSPNLKLTLFIKLKSICNT